MLYFFRNFTIIEPKKYVPGFRIFILILQKVITGVKAVFKRTFI